MSLAVKLAKNLVHRNLNKFKDCDKMIMEHKADRNGTKRAKGEATTNLEGRKRKRASALSNFNFSSFLNFVNWH